VRGGTVLVVIYCTLVMLMSGVAGCERGLISVKVRYTGLKINFCVSLGQCTVQHGCATLFRWRAARVTVDM